MNFDTVDVVLFDTKYFLLSMVLTMIKIVNFKFYNLNPLFIFI